MLNARETNVVEVYDPVTNNWSNAPSMIVKRCQFALVSHNRKLFAIGGYAKSSNTHLSSVEDYDLETNRWNFVASMIKPTSAMNYGVSEISN